MQKKKQRKEQTAHSLARSTAQYGATQNSRAQHKATTQHITTRHHTTACSTHHIAQYSNAAHHNRAQHCTQHRTQHTSTPALVTTTPPSTYSQTSSKIILKTNSLDLSGVPSFLALRLPPTPQGAPAGQPCKRSGMFSPLLLQRIPLLCP